MHQQRQPVFQPTNNPITVSASTQKEAQLLLARIAVKEDLRLTDAYRRLLSDIFGIGVMDDTQPGPTKMKQVDFALATLTDCEARVIRLRYGIDPEGPLTRAAIGTSENVGRERIRQIEAKALRKLRHYTRRKLFA